MAENVKCWLDRITDVAKIPIPGIARTPLLLLLQIGGPRSLNKYCGSRIIKGPIYTSGQRVGSGKFSESGWVAEVEGSDNLCHHRRL